MANFRRALFSFHRFLNSNSAHTSITPIISPIHSQSLSRRGGSFLRFYSSTQSLDIDLSNEESKRRLFNRLLYRSKQRGFLELDLVLGKWVQEHIHSLDENGIKSLVCVLDQMYGYIKSIVARFATAVELENPDLWKWLTDQEKPPEAIDINPVFCAVREKVVNNLNNYAAPETRATPDQQWVRGWDDFKKGRDGPVSGNQ